MAVSADQIERLRRMTNEPTTDTYSDDALTAYIFRYPLIDSYGREPHDLEWSEDYDLASAAALIWGEKAGTLVCNFDFSADGSSYSRSQTYEMAIKQARYWASRRAPRSLRVVVSIDFERDLQADPVSVITDGGGDTTYIINLPEPEDDD